MKLKKALATFLAAAMLSLLAAGCGSQKDPVQDAPQNGADAGK